MKQDERRPLAKPSEPVKAEKVAFRFTAAHTHAGLPFEAGDEITIEPFWADIIAAMGSGQRIQERE